LSLSLFALLFEEETRKKKKNNERAKRVSLPRVS
tara:strand:- start:972 stop:1073 length:102 start_codon:yes stop_codon:yes gene_type:complete